MFKFYFKEVFSKKARTFLIALSVAVGVASVLIIDAISCSGTALINAELDNLGLKGFSVKKSALTVNSKLNNSDLEAIKSIDCVNTATPIVTTTGFFMNDILPSAVFCGIDETAVKIISLQMLKGEEISKRHIDENANVCLIDIITKEALFGKESKGVGEVIKTLICGKSVKLTVIGVIKSGSSIIQSSIGEMLPTVIYLPYTSLQDFIGNNSIDQIAVNAKGEDTDTTLLEQAINTALIDNKSNSKLVVSNLNKSRENLNSFLNIVTDVLRFIGGISLIVSGLGITAITLMSVAERKREIGIKKSIGAKSSDIATEFIAEAAIITLLGAILGFGFSLILSYIINSLFDVAIVISPRLSLFVTLLSLTCSVIFSLYPAYKAATLNPIESLREEL